MQLPALANDKKTSRKADARFSRPRSISACLWLARCSHRFLLHETTMLALHTLFMPFPSAPLASVSRYKTGLHGRSLRERFTRIRERRLEIELWSNEKWVWCFSGSGCNYHTSRAILPVPFQEKTILHCSTRIKTTNLKRRLRRLGGLKGAIKYYVLPIDLQAPSRLSELFH